MAYSSTKGFCLLNFLIASVELAWVMTIQSSEMFERVEQSHLTGWIYSCGSDALVMELTICVEQGMKSVFVITPVYEVQIEVLFMVTFHKNAHRGLIDILITQSLKRFRFGAIETLHHLPTFKPSVTRWQHLISHLKGLCRQVLCKPTSVSWTWREAG